MGRQDIIDRINSCEDRIDDNNSQIEKLKGIYEDVKMILFRLRQSQEVLQEYRQNTKDTANNMLKTFTHSEFIKLFADILKNAADDIFASKAEEGLYDSVNVANNKLDELSSKIEELEEDNTHCRNRIDDYRHELSQLEEEEV